jgi:hypothetical protein
MTQGHRLLFNHPAIGLMEERFFWLMPPHFATKYPERFRNGYGKYATSGLCIWVRLAVNCPQPW